MTMGFDLIRFYFNMQEGNNNNNTRIDSLASLGYARPDGMHAWTSRKLKLS